MPHICPRPCSRLAAAAVFISVGVVQFIVGIILLRSKYVYLLSGPDLWTSASNISIGCLLGVSASVWKRSKKRKSNKHVIRRNLLAALLISAITVNATTAIILIMGEGNTLLSIQLENGRYGSTTFASEILAYAYATSVCSPIVCIVVAIVALSGNCFQITDKKGEKSQRTPRKVLNKADLYNYNWVYTPETSKTSKCAREYILTSSSSESSSDDTDLTPNHFRGLPLIPKYSHSVEDLTTGLYRMTRTRRNQALCDSISRQRLMPQRCSHVQEYNSSDGSYRDARLLDLEDHCRDHVKHRKGVLVSDGGYSPYCTRHAREKTVYKETLLSSLSDKLPKDCMKCGQDLAGVLESEDTQNLPTVHELTRCSTERSKSDRRLHKDTSQSNESKSSTEKSAVMADIHQQILSAESLELVHGEGNNTFENETTMIVGMEEKSPPDVSACHEKEDISIGNSVKIQRISTPEKMHALARRKSFSPDDSVFDADSTFEASRISWVGDVVPIRVNSFSKISSRLVPVATPKVPESNNAEDVVFSKISDGTSDFNCNDSISKTGVLKNKFKISGTASLGSFRTEKKDRIKDNVTFEYPKMGTVSPLNRKRELSVKISSMAPITEVPSEEANADICQASLTQTSGYVSSSLEESTNSPIQSKQTPTNPAKEKSVSVNSDVVVGNTPKRASPGCTPKRKRDRKRQSTPKKTTRGSPKNVLRRMWEAVGTDEKLDFLDQIVDDDSLIGLTEEDLISRQLRTRSLRKVAEQRIKQDMKE